MTQHEAQLNGFLVNVFNDILRLEEASIRKGPCKNLSVSEMHVLEAVEKSSVDASGAAGMAEVAAHLSITSGTLSVAVKTLEQKGCLVRSRGSRDKRRVTVALDICRAVRAGKPRGIPRNTGRPCSCPPERGRNSGALHRARLPARFFRRIGDSRRTGPASHFPGRCSIPCGPGGGRTPHRRTGEVL